MNLVAIDYISGEVLVARTFDTAMEEKESDRLLKCIKSLRNGAYVVLALNGQGNACLK